MVAFLEGEQSVNAINSCVVAGDTTGTRGKSFNPAVSPPPPPSLSPSRGSLIYEVRMEFSISHPPIRQDSNVTSLSVSAFGAVGSLLVVIYGDGILPCFRYLVMWPFPRLPVLPVAHLIPPPSLPPSPALCCVARNGIDSVC